MIKKINKIKNLGLVFTNYAWDANLPLFKRFNLIYGWNGNGKTTLSKLFEALNTGYLKDNPNLEYEIEDEADTKYKQSEVFNKKIRVFNEDYVENNIKLVEGRANSISILLGEENKELVEQIEEDEKILNGDSTIQSTFGKVTLFSNCKREKDQKINERGDKFTEIAKTIGAAIGGNALRDYRKPQAETDFAILDSKTILNDKDLRKYSLSAKQLSLPSIGKLTLQKIKLKEESSEIEVEDALSSVLITAEQLLKKTVEAEVISHLAKNNDISDWVEQGMQLHSAHMSKVCEYCLQVVPKSRLEQLMRHFNKADKELKANIDELLSQLKKIYSVIDITAIPDRARFYSELQADYDVAKDKFETSKKELLISINNLENEIMSKKAKTTESITLSIRPNATVFLSDLQSINKLITDHDGKTSDFEKVKKDSDEKLKLHWLSTIFDEVKKLDTEINDCEKISNKLENGDSDIPGDLGIVALRRRIFENKAKISSTHKACEEINKGLATFLGRKELHFEPLNKTVVQNDGKKKEVDDGYSIMRGNNKIHSLSGSEKTAIAFVYFVVQLRDQDFDLKDGIVVIDDPISSFDSNSLYQAFAFLKNAVEDAKQIFIFTHNFDFLKLLLNWIKHAPIREGKNYYMIKNCYVDNNRCAYLDKMDKELCDYESEYHYLFKILKEFESDGTIAQAYPIPNIARKVLDTFLLFRIPSGSNSYDKLEKIKETTNFDKNKITAIYKFTNDQSHITGSGFDPALVQETQKNVKYLLQMIQEIFPEHYKILEESIN